MVENIRERCLGAWQTCSHLLPLISFLDVFSDNSSSSDSMALSVGIITKAVKESCHGTLLNVCLQEIEENHK
jgi:hypothetical protein